MTYSKLLQTRTIFLIALTLVGSYWLPLPNGNLRAQVESTSAKHSKYHLNGQLPQPQGKQADAGRPESPSGQPQGGGTRTSCTGVGKLTALVPTSSNKQALRESQNFRTLKATSNSNMSLTAAGHPTFWLYVPYTSSSTVPRPVTKIEFVLQEENGNNIYQTSITKPQISPGVVGVQLPSTAPSLEVNKRYQWYFQVYCNPEVLVDDSVQSDAHIQSWVQRVALNPSLESQLKQATPQERAALYTDAGIWLEAVTTLAQLRRQNPNNVKLREEWVQLLKDVNLDAIADEPIVSVLTPRT
jgi:hypothetical protein